MGSASCVWSILSRANEPKYYMGPEQCFPTVAWQQSAREIERGTKRRFLCKSRGFEEWRKMRRTQVSAKEKGT